MSTKKYISMEAIEKTVMSELKRERKKIHLLDNIKV